MDYSTFLIAFGLTLLLCFGVLYVFPKLGLMDRPERYGHQRKPIPYPGGIALIIGVLVTVLISVPMDRALSSVITGAILLTVTSFIDDRRGLSPYLRLGIQFIAGFMIVLGGIGILSISHPFGGVIALDSWQIPIQLGDFLFTLNVFADLLTIIWVIVMINSFNWIDGVPGMTSSIAAISALVLLILSLRPGFHSVDQSLAIVLSASIFAGSIAFLIFDFPKPKMLMGDTGSMTLGFLLAVTAMISGGKIATTMLVLSFPLLDFIWVIGRRLSQKKSPFKGDLWHFHHRLLRAGYKPRQIILFYVLTASIFGASALWLQTQGKVLVFGLIFVFMILLASFLYKKQVQK